MKLKSLFVALLLLTGGALFATNTSAATPRGKQFQQMTDAEKTAYVNDQALRVAQAITGRYYELSPEFVAAVRQRIERYAARVGVKTRGTAGKEDLRFVFERGAQASPEFARVFREANLSPLVGIYLPFIESEYRTDLTSPMGAAGMFQFLDKTAVRYGITPEERNDNAKAAGAAVRYLDKLNKQFNGDIFLSLLAYNQGEGAVEKYLTTITGARDAACGICALTAGSAQLPPNFQQEGVYYVPQLLAAAIIGENPQDFGLNSSSLSSVANIR